MPSGHENPTSVSSMPFDPSRFDAHRQAEVTVAGCGLRPCPRPTPSRWRCGPSVWRCAPARRAAATPARGVARFLRDLFGDLGLLLAFRSTRQVRRVAGAAVPACRHVEVGRAAVESRAPWS